MFHTIVLKKQGLTDFNEEYIPKNKKGDFIKISAREAVRILSVGHGECKFLLNEHYSISILSMIFDIFKNRIKHFRLKNVNFNFKQIRSI